MIKLDGKLKPCHQCGFNFNCLCHQTPTLVSKVNIALLLHKNELKRETNTGKLISKVLPNSQRFIWDRVTPPQDLLDLILSERFNPILLFPTDSSFIINKNTFSQSTKPPLFIFLDATWQEAKKMVRRSSWLQSLTCAQLPINKKSAYSLRRNQEIGNLCTSEAASVLLRCADEQNNADQLELFFHRYLAVFKADKSGHQLKN